MWRLERSRERSGDNISLVLSENFHPQPAPLLSDQLASGLKGQGTLSCGGRGRGLRRSGWVWKREGALPRPRPGAPLLGRSGGRLVPDSGADHLPGEVVWGWGLGCQRFVLGRKERGEERGGEGEGRGRARRHPSVPASPAPHSPAPRVCLQTADSRLLPQGPNWHFPAFCAALKPVTVTSLSPPPPPSDPFSCLPAEKKPLAAWAYKCFVDTRANQQKATGSQVLRGRRPPPLAAPPGTLEEAGRKALAPSSGSTLSPLSLVEAGVGGRAGRGPAS